MRAAPRIQRDPRGRDASDRYLALFVRPLNIGSAIARHTARMPHVKTTPWNDVTMNATANRKSPPRNRISDRMNIMLDSPPEKSVLSLPSVAAAQTHRRRRPPVPNV